MSEADQQWTIKAVLGWSADYLAKNGSPTSRLDAEVLLADALQCTRVQLYTGYDKPLDCEERDHCRKSIFRRAKGEPVAYIVGKKSFWKNDFIVTPDVLIPRSDTELLIDLVDRRIKNTSVTRILDLGTGSGCIALSLAKMHPDTHFIGWDISEKALAIAKKNIALLNINNVELNRCDGLNAETWQDCRFDIVVSNPPYVATKDRGGILERSVQIYEPDLALYGGADGLDFYQKLAKVFEEKKSCRSIFLEVGQGQAEFVKEIFAPLGFKSIGFHKDLAGIERVVQLEDTEDGF